MKFITMLVFLGAASSVYSQGIDSVILAIENYLDSAGLKYRETCISESGVNRALVDTFEKEGTIPNDEQFKCYVQCQGFKANVIDDKGIINMAILKAILKATNSEFIDMVEKQCKFPNKTHLCEAAYDACNCIHNILYNHHHLH